MRALLDRPEVRRVLADDPTKVPPAIAELLRMYPAFGHFRRIAINDVELRGKTIHKGDKIVLW